MMKTVFLMSLAVLALAGKTAFFTPADPQAETRPFAMPPAVTVSALDSAGMHDQS